MFKSVELEIDEQGRLVISSELKAELGLEPGMTLVVEPGDDGELRLRLEHEALGLIEEEGLLVFRGELLEDVTNIIQEERERRISELIQPSCGYQGQCRSNSDL
jgi:bifunctional DNA-binding transcriptional regulator/antitoxin component of YhaV-PrlF toxin-antitoxin module